MHAETEKEKKILFVLDILRNEGTKPVSVS